MLIHLIENQNSSEDTSDTFQNAPGNKFTISGYSAKNRSWGVQLEKMFSDNNWVAVKSINTNTPMITLEDGGNFRIHKPEGVVCLIDLEQQ